MERSLVRVHKAPRHSDRAHAADMNMLNLPFRRSLHLESKSHFVINDVNSSKKEALPYFLIEPKLRRTRSILFIMGRGSILFIIGPRRAGAPLTPAPRAPHSRTPHRRTPPTPSHRPQTLQTPTPFFFSPHVHMVYCTVIRLLT